MSENKKDARFYLGRGIEKGEKGKYKEALEDYDKAIELDSKNSSAYYNRGVTKYKLDRYEEAITDCDEAIKLDPKYAVAYYGRGFFKKALKQYEEAIKDFESFLELAGEKQKDFREPTNKLIEECKASAKGKEPVTATKAAPIPSATGEPYKKIDSETVMFIDICGSTKTMHLHGGKHFLEMFRILKNLFNDKAKEHGCLYYKGLGDGFMAIFADDKEAVKAAIEILEVLKEHNSNADKKSQINIRIGLDYGQVYVGDDNNRFGIPVNTAARLEGIQKKGFEVHCDDKESLKKLELLEEKNRILITYPINTSIESEIKCDEIGWVDLKGFPGIKVGVFQVNWQNPK